MFYQWTEEHGILGVVAMLAYAVFLFPVFVAHVLLKGLFGKSIDEWKDHFENEEAEEILRLEENVERLRETKKVH